MFWERYLALCNEIGKSPSAVAIENGKSDAASSGWKKGAMPRDNVLQRLANYFGVSVEYLKGETDDRGQKETAAPEGDGMSDKDIRLLAWFRSLPPEKQKEILYDADAPAGLV